MKSIDKKTIILISVLLTIATLVIVISQTAMDKTGGNKFGVVEVQTTTVITETSTVETTAPTTSAEPESTLQQDITETITAETVEETKSSPKYTVYNTYSLENATLVISDDNKYVLSNDSASFSGNIRNVSSGDDTPIKNRKLKKLGLNPKTIDKNNLFYVQLEYDKHEFVKDGQTYVSYFNTNVNHAKKTSFNILIYYDENGASTVYDLNGDIVGTDFNNFYF